MKLNHNFPVVTRPKDWKGDTCPKEKKVSFNIELTFSSEQAILDIALNRIQTISVHKWFKDKKDWLPGQTIRIDESGNRSLTREEKEAAILADADVLSDEGVVRLMARLQAKVDAMNMGEK